MVHQLIIYGTPAARHAICQTYTIRYEHGLYAQRTTNGGRTFLSRSAGVPQLWNGRYPNVVRTLSGQDRMITRTR